MNSRLSKFLTHLPGLAFCYIISLVAGNLAKLSPQVGTISFSLLLGVALANLISPPAILGKGIAFARSKFLETAIVLLGLSLSYQDLAIVNPYTVFVLCTMVTIVVFVSIFLGRYLGLSNELSLLMGMGNAICGSAAILAASKVIDAPKKDTAAAITMTNILGITTLFILPLFLKNYDPKTCGFLIGGALQAMGHVIASVALLDAETAHYAVTIKMARIFLLTPVMFFLSFIYKKKQDGDSSSPKIPGYMIGFLVCIVLANSGALSTQTLDFFKFMQKTLLAIAMAGLGLGLQFSQIFHKLRTNLLLGASIFALQILFLVAAMQFL